MPLRRLLFLLVLSALPLALWTGCDSTGPEPADEPVAEMPEDPAEESPSDDSPAGDGSEDEPGDEPPPDEEAEDEQEDQACTIPVESIFDGGVGGRDGIPALSDPPMVAAGGALYLADADRVVGIVVDGIAMAIPHNILWWHEIVNLNDLAEPLSVTYCPLTGSSIAFRREEVDGAEFGVSGLLYLNNLIMYDRNDFDSLWPQMLGSGACGPEKGTPLTPYPVADMTWAGWQELHPNTLVVDDETGFTRRYDVYPYGDYERPSNPDVLFPQRPHDRRRPPKERVLGVPDDKDGGVAFPFGVLDEQGTFAVAESTVGGSDVVVFWDRAKETGLAFRPEADGRRLSLSADADGFLDAETGSRWRVDGLAIDGELAGMRLDPVEEAFVAFWFAWAAFYPTTDVWPGSG